MYELNLYLQYQLKYHLWHWNEHGFFFVLLSNVSKATEIVLLVWENCQNFNASYDRYQELWASLGHPGFLEGFGQILVNFGDFGPLSGFGPHWAILGHFWGLGHFWPFGLFWATLPKWHFGPLWAAWASLGNFGHFWGLAHFGTFWATFWAPILGFRFGYDQADCVAPVFKKELTWISAYPLSPLTSKGRAPCNWKKDKLSNIEYQY